ncbi:MAG: hypothetical protein SAL07_20515 [Oscillatoria sp. PMC 1051.18]|nr:hypothetical protein [Oscillatoria sp. PMC 1051.18]
MADSKHRNEIILALIGLVSALGVALISNWDKILSGFQSPDQPSPKDPPTVTEDPETDPPETDPPINENENFSLDIDTYEIGDLPDEGTNLLVKERDGRKAIIGLTDGGKLEITNLKLTGNFSIVFEVTLNNIYNSIFSVESTTSEKVSIIFDGPHATPYITFGTMRGYDNTGWKSGKNKYEIIVRKGLAKFYINDQFFNTIEIEPTTVFTTVSLTGIGQDEALFTLNATNKATNK